MLLRGTVLILQDSLLNHITIITEVGMFNVYQLIDDVLEESSFPVDVTRLSCSLVFEEKAWE